MYNDIYDKEHFAYMYSTLTKWLKLKIDGGDLSQQINKIGVNNVALYGAGIIGELVLSELLHFDTRINCIIDRCYADYPNGINHIPVIGINQLSEFDYDAVIVTPVYHFQAILTDLIKGGTDPIKIISLSMLLP